MIEIRRVLTMNVEERDEVKAEHPEIAQRVALHWNGGKVCGQCNQFSQLGTRGGSLKNTGLNGVCMANHRGGYIRPEEIACSNLERVE